MPDWGRNLQRPLNAEERALWARVIATVRPLHGHPAPAPPPAAPTAAPSAKPKPVQVAPKPVQKPAPARPKPGETLDASWDRRLSRGLAQPDVTVDLHGHSLAGDEVTMRCPDVRDSREAERIARSALTALSAPFEISGQVLDMGGSIGVALYPRHGDELTTLMKAADIAMYHAKASGRSQYCLYHPRLAAAFDKKSQTERALRRGAAGNDVHRACGSAERREFEVGRIEFLGAVVEVERIERGEHARELRHRIVGAVRPT